MNAPNDFRTMTAETIGKDLLQAIVQEIKLMPDVWQKLSQSKQDDILDRLRERVGSNVKMAVHLLASSGRTVVVGDLEQITIKDGAKAVIKIGRSAESLHELYDAQGKAVLVVVSDVGEHTGGMDEITSEPDQRAMDLGHEYHNNDGGGMDERVGDDVIDGEATEVLGLPSPDEVTPTEQELQDAFDAGSEAAEVGEPESACPVMKGLLCIQWEKGWKAWHGAADQDPSGNNAPVTAIRYRHPDDKSLTWTGRGRKPQWVLNWIATGGTLADLEVPQDSDNTGVDLE